MARSFTDRILGGVCGGLAARLPFGAAVWRGLFIALTLIAPPGGIALYLLLWWLLPQETPMQRRRGGFSALIALALGALLILGWFARASLRAPNGADVYIPLLLLVLALVFVFRQMQMGAWQNVLMGLVFAALPAVAIAGALEMIPGGIFDVVLRGLPVVLVFFGVALLLRERVPYGGFVGLVASAVLVGGLVTYAYGARVNNVLDQNKQLVIEPVAPTVTTLQVNIETQATEVRFYAASPDVRAVTVDFAGSHESVISHEYGEEGSVATFTLRETRPNQFPLLENIGRGTMAIELPQNVAVSVAFAGADGSATFDMGLLDLERLTAEVQLGDVLVRLPAYQPLSPAVAENPGSVTALNGNLRVIVPPDVGGQFEIAPNSNPQYDDALYRIELEPSAWLMVARNYDDSDIQIRYRLSAPRGQIRLDVEG